MLKLFLAFNDQKSSLEIWIAPQIVLLRWRVDQNCAEIRPSAAHPCDGSTEKRYSGLPPFRYTIHQYPRQMAERECSKLKDATFASCHSQVPISLP